MKLEGATGDQSSVTIQLSNSSTLGPCAADSTDTSFLPGRDWNRESECRPSVSIDELDSATVGSEHRANDIKTYARTTLFPTG